SICGPAAWPARRTSISAQARVVVEEIPDQTVDQLKHALLCALCGNLLGRPVLRRIVDDLIPLIGGRARDKSDQRAVADIEDLVRHAGLDVDKIAGLVDHPLPQALAVALLH